MLIIEKRRIVSNGMCYRPPLKKLNEAIRRKKSDVIVDNEEIISDQDDKGMSFVV